MRRRLRSVILVFFRRILYVPCALLLAVLGFKVLRLTHPDRIGHLAGEVDCLLKERLLDVAPQRRFLLLLPRDRIANSRITEYWPHEVATIRSPLGCRLANPLVLSRLTRFPKDMSRYVGAIGETATAMRIQRDWGTRPPLLRLKPADIERGEQALRRVGMPAGARFVCMHGREGGYSPADEHYHGYRNTSIERYMAAAEALVGRGLFCVRMGDPSMRPMPRMDGVLDYAHLPVRSDWLDLFLCARSEFFLGCTSGLYFVAIAFGVPCALANLVPISAALATGSPRDLGISKLLWSDRERRYLHFPEILGSTVADFRFDELYVRDGIRAVENDAADIRGLALEMLDRVEGRAAYAPEDEARQVRFKALFRPGHNSYGSASRIGRDFLRKYESLLG